MISLQSKGLLRVFANTTIQKHQFFGSWYGPNRAEVIKKRWQEYTEKLYKKDLHDQDNHDGVITHLEPDILECEVKKGLRKHHYKQS